MRSAVDEAEEMRAKEGAYTVEQVSLDSTMIISSQTV